MCTYSLYSQNCICVLKACTHILCHIYRTDTSVHIHSHKYVSTKFKFSQNRKYIITKFVISVYVCPCSHILYPQGRVDPSLAPSLPPSLLPPSPPSLRKYIISMCVCVCVYSYTVPTSACGLQYTFCTVFLHLHLRSCSPFFFPPYTRCLQYMLGSFFF